MTDTEADPLTDLYKDRNAVDRQRLHDVLAGIVSFDTETGEVIYEDTYFELDNKLRFVAQLLARETARLLGERDGDEVGGDSHEFAELLGVGHSAVQNYASDLEFVANDDECGGYVVRPHFTGAAIVHLADAMNTADSTGEVG